MSFSIRKESAILIRVSCEVVVLKHGKVGSKGGNGPVEYNRV